MALSVSQLTWGSEQHAKFEIPASPQFVDKIDRRLIYHHFGAL